MALLFCGWFLFDSLGVLLFHLAIVLGRDDVWKDAEWVADVEAANRAASLLPRRTHEPNIESSF
jgi:hypothetical protein